MDVAELPNDINGEGQGGPYTQHTDAAVNNVAARLKFKGCGQSGPDKFWNFLDVQVSLDWHLFLDKISQPLKKFFSSCLKKI